ncbi:hypothetical protein ACFVVL_16175 [Kitasatospora sp. NPDC058115]
MPKPVAVVLVVLLLSLIPCAAFTEARAAGVGPAATDVRTAPAG